MNYRWTKVAKDHFCPNEDMGPKWLMNNWVQFSNLPSFLLQHLLFAIHCTLSVALNKDLCTTCKLLLKKY